MKELLAPAFHELVIDRSRFVCLAQPIETPEQARQQLKEWKAYYLGANHVVHAFVVGQLSSQVTGYSDDGEPPGTAGRPLMDVIAGSGISGILVGVVRYFGGVKLGTGGLVKAYQACGKELLPLLKTREWELREVLNLCLSYSSHQALLHYLESSPHTLKGAQYDSEVTVTLEVLVEKKQELERWLQDQIKKPVTWL